MGLPLHPKPRDHRLWMSKLHSGNNPRNFFHVEQSCVCGFRSDQYTNLAPGFCSTVSSHPSLLVTQQSLGMTLNFMNFINTWMQLYLAVLREQTQILHLRRDLLECLILSLRASSYLCLCVNTDLSYKLQNMYIMVLAGASCSQIVHLCLLSLDTY